jgi:hypothetical protein
MCITLVNIEVYRKSKDQVSRTAMRSDRVGVWLMPRLQVDTFPTFDNNNINKQNLRAMEEQRLGHWAMFDS